MTTASEVPRRDDGSGSVLGLSVIGSVVGVLSLTLPLYIGLSVGQSVAGAADAAALAGADVASGIAPGTPCGLARQIAGANGASVEACAVDGLVVTVRANRVILGIRLAATATAGPPDAVTN